MPIERRECNSCGHVYELLSVNGKDGRWNVAAPDPDNDPMLGCEMCGELEENSKKLPAVSFGVGLGSGNGSFGGQGDNVTYPYFDRGMGIWIESSSHRRREYKARGLVPMDGGVPDMEGHIARQKEAREQAEQARREQEDYMMNGPGKANYRKALDVIEREGLSLWEDR